jgi:hypothetical protein
MINKAPSANHYCNALTVPSDASDAMIRDTAIFSRFITVLAIG